jgi:ABC-type Fe3+ transport system substrate-binding protein
MQLFAATPEFVAAAGTNPLRARRVKRGMPAAVVVGLALAAMLGTSAANAAPRAGNIDGQKVEVAAVWSGAEQKSFRAVLDAFEAKTGASVSYTSTGDDIAATLTPRIARGDTPDVAILPQPGLLSDLASRGSLKPIQGAAGRAVDANYAPVWRELGSANGTLYGVWFKAADKSLWWYNAKILKDAGVTVPTTIDGLMKAATTVGDFGVTPISVGAADGWTLTDQFENIYLAQAGGDRYDRLAKHQIPWTDPSVKAALTTMSQLLAPNMIAGGANGALQTEFPASVSQVFGSTPDAAMTMEGDFVAGVIKAETTATVGKDAKVFPYPGVTAGDPPVIAGGDVAVLMNDSAAGRALIAYLASPEAASVWAKRGGFVSANKKVKPGAYPDPVTRQIAGQLVAAGDSVRFDLSDQQPAAFGATVGQGLWKQFQDFLTSRDVDSTASAMEASATQAYASTS